jgi:serine/threonine-protein phosphatase 6 regulatory ankyrin repeat subunit B
MNKLILLILLLAVSPPAFTQDDFHERSPARDALFNAIESGDAAAVKKILSKRRHVNLNFREVWDGETFLIEAIRAEQPEIVRLLLTHGADPNLKEIEGVDAHDKSILGDSPLAAALGLEESTEMVKLLVQHGLRLSQYPAALHSTNSIEMLQFLLDHGAMINGRNEDGATYLQVAAADAGGDSEAEEVALFLIARGANVNIPDNNGATPLLRCQSIEVAQALIEHGANVNTYDKEQMTPLHMAAFGESRSALGRLLVKHGANVNARNNEGYTPLDFLVADDFRYDFALFLVAHGAQLNEALIKEHQLTEEFEQIRKAIQSGNLGEEDDPPMEIDSMS